MQQFHGLKYITGFRRDRNTPEPPDGPGFGYEVGDPGRMTVDTRRD